jgi:hypothetical protein
MDITFRYSNVSWNIIIHDANCVFKGELLSYLLVALQYTIILPLLFPFPIFKNLGYSLLQ